ncbi:uncharacterized protein LOC113311964 [Papaver somniferum]|uniref:uncharacterized protein LOC113311964 n=1 Tax=Papaver somniferum TaxID=3469 RepID=UPI000E6FC3ED|nr:uncharacterized protein LOC113311964 [Papaver somniferum]
MVHNVQKIATFTIKNGKVFQAVRDKDAIISDMLSETGLHLEEEDEMSIMENYNTQNCFEVLSGDLAQCSFVQHLWKSYVPHKVSFILWDTFHNSLPTRDMLIRRGMEIESDRCLLYNTEMETVDHMFIHCSYSFEVWDYFIKAFKISWPLPGTLLQLFDAWKTNVLSGRSKEVRRIVHYAICWLLWKERSGRVFGARQRCASETIDHVKMLIVLWLSDTNTFKFVNSSLVWSNWDTLMSA